MKSNPADAAKDKQKIGKELGALHHDWKDLRHDRRDIHRDRKDLHRNFNHKSSGSRQRQRSAPLVSDPSAAGPLLQKPLHPGAGAPRHVTDARPGSALFRIRGFWNSPRRIPVFARRCGLGRFRAFHGVCHVVGPRVSPHSLVGGPVDLRPGGDRAGRNRPRRRAGGRRRTLAAATRVDRSGRPGDGRSDDLALSGAARRQLSPLFRMPGAPGPRLSHARPQWGAPLDSARPVRLSTVGTDEARLYRRAVELLDPSQKLSAVDGVCWCRLSSHLFRSGSSFASPIWGLPSFFCLSCSRCCLLPALGLAT